MPTRATRLDTSSPNFMRIGGALFCGGRGLRSDHALTVKQVTAPLCAARVR